MDTISINGLKIACIIGIFDWERKQKQEVSLDLRFPCDNRKAAQKDRIEDTVDYKRIAKATITFVEKSEFKLVETMAERLAEILLQQFALTEIFLKVSKPGALRGSQNVGVEIHRFHQGVTETPWMALGLGSNIDPRQNLNLALETLDQRFGLLGASHVYETAPVGYTRQPAFWNLAAAIHDPGGSIPTIRRELQAIEKSSGRIKTSKSNGPRTLDVDLLLRGELVNLKGSKKIPHPDLDKKAFVLFPLLEMMPWGTHPVSGLSFVEMAASFQDKKQKIRRLGRDTLAPYYPRTFIR